MFRRIQEKMEEMHPMNELEIAQRRRESG